MDHPTAPPLLTAVGVIIIGDEILSGQRRERHLEHIIATLGSHGVTVAWCWLLGDQRERLVAHLRWSRQGTEPVFCFGGIGATPDDHTRQAAASAWGTPLERHPEAARIIERRFGPSAHPHRIRMADLPAGCRLIPNPVVEIPGFSLDRHHFLPGFPELAWPMLAGVVAAEYTLPQWGERQLSLCSHRAREGDMVPLLEALEAAFPGVRSVSLPTMGPGGATGPLELGVKGHDPQQVAAAFQQLQRELEARGLDWSGTAQSSRPMR